MQRRLAAIMVADMVGYSKLMEADQNKAMDALRRLRGELFEPIVATHRGQVVKRMGDGWIVEFPSIFDAVICAIAIQSGLVGHEIIQLRIGIHTGEVVFENDDIFGDSVNIAARLEALADPGQVLISDTAHSSLDGAIAEKFTGGETHNLKNISRPVSVWHWPETVKKSSWTGAESLPLPDKPSIAVLPFENMSGDPEQEFFADGVVEDILTTLSKIPALFVIARNSSFQFKGKSVDVRDVGRILGVRYVLEGSVRKSGNKVRVTAQLIDCSDGQHIWADRFDGILDDVFELQDKITREVVTRLEVNLTVGEQVYIWRQRSGNPLAYEKFLQARELYSKFTRQTHSQARLLFEKTLKDSPAFTSASIMLGFTLTDQARFNWIPSSDQGFQKALDIAEKALEIDPDYAAIHTVTSYTRTYQRRHDEAIAATEKALAFGPNDAHSVHMAAITYVYAGEFRFARDYQIHYRRLVPLGQYESSIELARAHFHLGEYENARNITEQILNAMPHWLTAQTILLSSLWRMEMKDEASKIFDVIIRNHPKFSVERWSRAAPYRNPDDLSDLMNPLLEAGLPE